MRTNHFSIVINLLFWIASSLSPPSLLYNIHTPSSRDCNYQKFAYHPKHNITNITQYPSTSTALYSFEC